MHAFLIVGKDKKTIDEEIGKIANRLKAVLIKYGLSKIEDARYLSTLTSLKLQKTTAYVLSDIDNATPEAQSAFLKNLEEPQERLYYVLTAANVAALLPTITSRCQIIKLPPKRSSPLAESESFMNLSVGKKLAYTDGIKNRDGAKIFVEDLINKFHSDLIGAKENHAQIAENLKIATATFDNLKANGNITLQLTNMVINLI